MADQIPQHQEHSRQRGLAQRRAEAAYRAVNAVMNPRPQSWAKEYKQLAQNAPADIQANGLGQTLAFWKSKAKDHHLRLFNDVSDWLRKEFGFDEQKDALQWIAAEAGPGEYRRATGEAIELLVWIKRFAAGYIPDQENHHDQQNPRA